ncbi:MAG TPA: CRTAC1 family protein [Gemmataceae bacterium]|nr:CRTAC1 family protein [Gemmataceae bacterium]
MRLLSVVHAVLHFLVALALLSAGCRQPGLNRAPESGASPPWFLDITEQVGIHFLHDAGPEGKFFMPQIMGSGAALFDFDNDGRLDIYLIQNGGPGSPSCNRLFRQGADGRFVDVSKGSGLDIGGYGMGVAIGDVNNDGWPDVLVTEYGGVRLFLNNGNGTFSEVTQTAGLENPLWATSASFVDYDRDGWLDLVIVNYVDYDATKICTEPGGKSDYCGPSSFPGTVTRLYRNLGVKSRPKDEETGRQGDRQQLSPSPPLRVSVPRFEDVTLRAGLGRVPGPGLGVVCADFNGDRWPDLFIANDGEPNRLWINQHDGTFTEEAVVRGLAYNSLGRAEANMGIALGDVDGKGAFSVFVTHLTEQTNTLWSQGPQGMFQDQTAQAGLASPAWHATGFGTVLADFDHDGALDLAIVNGRVRRAKHPVLHGPATTLSPHWGAYAERNQLFANDGAGRFHEVSPSNPAFCGTPSVARGLACGDVDGDGALDLLVTTVAGPARLYRNVAAQRGHWLLVRALDPMLKRDAYGAEVMVSYGGRRQRRWVNPGYSYLCSNDPRVHFGLGSTAHIDAIEVLWPDGREETFPGRAADQVVVLRKGEGKIGSTEPRP